MISTIATILFVAAMVCFIVTVIGEVWARFIRDGWLLLCGHVLLVVAFELRGA